MKKKERQRGSVTLETSIILPIFFFLFLAIYSLIVVFSAHNQMSHALIQSSKSLSLDSYLTDSIESPDDAATNFWGGLTHVVEDIVRVTNNNTYFSSRKEWYGESSGMANDVAKRRFVGFLAGGDVAAAEEKLDALNIVGGLEGVTFETKVEGEILTITMNYKIQYMFDAFDMGKIPIEQSITTRLWKAESD